MRIEGIRLVEKTRRQIRPLSREGVMPWRCSRSPRRSRACSTDADAAAGRTRAARRGRTAACWPPTSRRCARSRRSTSPPWTAMRCAPPTSRASPAHAQARSARSRPAARSPATVGAGEAVRIFTGGVVPAGADTIVIQENTSARRRHASSSTSRAAPGAHIRRAGLDFAAGDVLLPQRPPAHRPRPGARRRHEPSDACRCTAGPRSRCSRPATSWCRPAASRARADRLFQRLRADGAGARAKAPRSIDLGIVPDRLDDTVARGAPRARRRRRHPGHHRRRLGRRPRPGAARRLTAEGHGARRSGRSRCGRASR